MNERCFNEIDGKFKVILMILKMREWIYKIIFRVSSLILCYCRSKENGML